MGAYAFSAAAGGFELKEGSASAIGAAFSGATAGANDVTYTFWNPAALTRVDGIEIGGAVSGILPTAEGVATPGGARIDGSEAAAVPAGYVAARLGSRVVLGVSVSAPFGLATEYQQTSFGVQAGVPRRSELQLVQIAPMISVDVTDTLTVAGGPTVATGNLIFETAGTGLGNLELDVNDTALGFQIGVLWDATPTTTIGASYHSAYNLSADGEANTSVLGTLPATFSADLPALATFGVRQGVTDDFRIQGEVQWQNWEAFDAAQIDLPAAAGGRSFNDFSYEDAWLFAVGGEYDATEALTLRAGFAYDQTPTSDATRSIRIPDQDRLWFTAGASYAVSENATLDVGYAYLTATEDAPASAGPANSAEFDDLHGHILSIGGTYRF